ncbi:hypothetical protein [Enterococcus rotai]|uniref:hypothetical protein n=1 Tax=Enterococcus rotai TaxID=118060 RepID=UPI0032B37488
MEKIKKELTMMIVVSSFLFWECFLPFSFDVIPSMGTSLSLVDKYCSLPTLAKPVVVIPSLGTSLPFFDKYCSSSTLAKPVVVIPSLGTSLPFFDKYCSSSTLAKPVVVIHSKYHSAG